MRSVPIALAPLLLLPLALWWVVTFLHHPMRTLYVAHVWIIAALLTASTPSPADIKLALPALITLGVLVVLFAWFLR